MRALVIPALAVMLVSAAFPAVAQSQAPQSAGERAGTTKEAAVPSLATLYKPFFSIGAAVEPQNLSTHEELLVAHFNSLVAENAMKWERIHPRRGNAPSSYSFYAADAIVDFAELHGMKVRGHTLVWHRQTPYWVFGSSGAAASRAEVLKTLREHIEAVMSRYRGKVWCWDVVNEALDDAGGWRSDSPWFQSAGGDEDGDGLPDYIVEAFRCARAADPAAKLFYNDYGIESGAKLEGAYRLAKALKEKGLLDGVGIQGHWSIYSPDPGTVNRAIECFASLGVDVQITELDLSVYRWGDSSRLEALPPELERRQAERYGELFRVFREWGRAGKLSNVTLWGVADDHTWLDSFPVSGRKDWPLLFDIAHQPKGAFWAIVQWK